METQADKVQAGQSYNIRGQSPITGELYSEGVAVVLDVQEPESTFDVAAARLLGAYLCRVRFANGDEGMRYVMAADRAEPAVVQ